MSRSSKSESGSDLIRRELARTPHATAQEIVESLKAQGVKVSAGLVYNVRATSSKRKNGKRHKSNPETNHTNGQAPRQTPLNPAAMVIKVKGLAEEVGGFGRLKELVDAVAP